MNYHWITVTADAPGSKKSPKPDAKEQVAIPSEQAVKPSHTAIKERACNLFLLEEERLALVQRRTVAMLKFNVNVRRIPLARSASLYLNPMAIAPETVFEILVPFEEITSTTVAVLKAIGRRMVKVGESSFLDLAYYRFAASEAAREQMFAEWNGVAGRRWLNQVVHANRVAMDMVAPPNPVEQRIARRVMAG